MPSRLRRSRQSSAASPGPDAVDPVDAVDAVPPPAQLVGLGFQHLAAFYAGAVFIPLVIAAAIGLDGEALTMLITADLFTCGVASILQACGFWKVGIRLPLVQGITFICMAPVIKIANDNGGGRDGLLVVFGAVIVAGIVTFLLAPVLARFVRFLPPIVTGTVITIVGLTLLPVGINGALTNPHTGDHEASNLRWMLYALGTIALIVLVQRFLRGFLAALSVLIGLVVGTLTAWALGDTSFDEVQNADWVGFTHPFAFGWPQFSAAAILTMLIVMLVIAVESTGSAFACGEIVGRPVSRDDIAAALRADGLATALGGTFNSFPYTAYNGNVGLVRMSGVRSRWVVVSAGVMMILLGFLPKLAGIVQAIPAPVLGGASIVLFATVAIVGIQTLGKTDLSDRRNLIIAAVSIGTALYVEDAQSVTESNGTVVPGIETAMPWLLQIPFGTGITMGAVVAITLNLLMFHLPGAARSRPVSERSTVPDGVPADGPA